MPSPRRIREAALQALYQVDVRADDDFDEVGASLRAGPWGREASDEALRWAADAWAKRDEADTLVAELAPAWPPPRQPVIDRSLLRLAYAEVTTGRTPASIAINEAIELSKRYSTQSSARFINGVLDGMMRRVGPAERPSEDTTADPWLADALADSPLTHGRRDDVEGDPE